MVENNGFEEGESNDFSCIAIALGVGDLIRKGKNFIMVECLERGKNKFDMLD